MGLHAVVATNMDTASVIVVVACGVVGIVFAVALLLCVKAIKLTDDEAPDHQTALLDKSDPDSGESQDESVMGKMVNIYSIIQRGAKAFLWAEYKLCFIFIAIFGAVVGVLVSHSGSVNAAAQAGNFSQNFTVGPSSDPYDMDSQWHGMAGGLTCASFVVGALTSIASGYIGMMVAVFSNARTTKQAMQQDEDKAWRDSFNAAFRAGGVMGYSLCGISLLMCYILIRIYNVIYPISSVFAFNQYGNPLSYSAQLFECLAGYGLGGSTIALFGRVGGGIYTKAADVGADLAGKVVENLPEDDPRNPAVIADNVGDNVGDVAGMGSDLFGSFGEATCAALVISSLSPEIVSQGLPSIIFPLYISAVGIPVCMLTSFIATNIWTVKGTVHKKLVHDKEVEVHDSNVETVLKVQLLAATIIMTAVLYPVCTTFLPKEFSMDCTIIEQLQAGAIPWFDGLMSNTAMLTGASSSNVWSFTYINKLGVNVTDSIAYPLCATHVVDGPLYAFISIICGLWGGCIIGFITEFYTSKSYKPTQELASSTKTGAATNIIYGLALGYQSVIIPIIILAIIIYVSFYLLGMFGVSLAALGMLSILATCLAIDVYGPVCDNAGGIAEMAGCEEAVRDKTDALDAAGNTTAAIGKGFAIGSAALVSLALFGAFVTRANLASAGINMLEPMTFSFLLLGCMLPYFFTAMTMKSVGQAAMKMVQEVARQFRENPHIMTGEVQPDYDLCIAISTDASLQQMIPPGLLVILTPILTGVLFGIEAVCGLLAGALVSAVQMAISQSNSGGAWDNAKKYIEKGELLDDDGNVLEKGSDSHKAAVVGDTVGDPLKDTSGPALNIVMKLMAIISLVFANFFLTINNGQGAFGLPNTQANSHPLVTP
mmetsp:Transcript_53765/g.79902  ORF Transcript_53765/g.79902 Transcript_53765/m.79902 type:complete len:882 (-) Transcript_53765:167-2812(-)|eukprot:CAMPEP_0195510058 /NCGR_PEP_ID=MMETSP0794_2-20130614/2810_1 /TAXON_ID=515487 /ORGANISM="Stephanopyxis turris, Strain CCMP 815" /LENGTH=881 /DNA_ID=CAMNT_0040637409 /DNA_START=75 /DNA_END=2720 /DNA_ORIENTATION=-